MQFDPAAAKAGKADGMARVAAGSNPAWRAQIQAYAVATAAALPEFTSDDVFLRAAKAGMTEETRDRRAFGPIMLSLAKAGVCRKANRPPVNSSRASLHASPRTVWKSLIFKGPHSATRRTEG